VAVKAGTGRRERAQTFSTRAAARILAISPDRIRYWVKHKLVSPAAQLGRRHRFAFGDLLLMRMAKELLPNRGRLKSFQRRFDGIAQYFGTRRALTSLNLENQDGRILVRDGDLVFEAESGQLLLWPESERPAGKIEDTFGQVRLRARFDEARRLAESDPLRALMLYNDLIRREPGNFELHLRTAALLEREGDLVSALRHLHGAAMLMPGNAEVHLRLGLLQRKREELDLAVQSFQRAIECDPLAAEAHRNLAELYDQLGRKREALRHFSMLHRLRRDS
jgi:tetratricopeptide (TPR) repeat protein